MAEYVSAPIETDPGVLTELAFDVLRERVPDWRADPAAFESVLLEAGGDMAAEVRDVASDVPASIFRWFGARLAGLPPVEAAPARAATTWTALDSAGYTIARGTVVGLRAAGDELVLFEVEDDVTIAPGRTATDVGQVLIAAQLEGADANGLGTAGGAVELVDTLPWVAGITMAGPTSGGVDAEDDEDYLDRLRTELELQSPRPILPGDFATLARRVAGVDRALALNLYKPAGVLAGGTDPEETNRERALTVAVVDENGEDPGVTVRGKVDDLLQSMREVNFEVWVIGPTYTTVDVTFTATAYPGWDAADVETRAEDAVREYLNPANWGIPNLADDREWIKETKVRHYEVAEVLNRVDGLWRVDSLTLGTGGGAQSANTDVTLAGAAPLPRAGAVAGTVAAS